jgi:hypothetical protein
MPTEPPTTGSFNFPLIPPNGEPNSSDFDGEWGYLLNRGEFSDGTASADTDGLLTHLDSLLDGTEQTGTSPTVVVAGGIPSVPSKSDLPDTSNVPEGTQYYVENEKEVYVLK